MKRSTYIWSLLVGCVAFATSCDLTEDVQVKADKSMIFGSKSGLELYSNSFYKALPTLKNGFMQDLSAAAAQRVSVALPVDEVAWMCS